MMPSGAAFRMRIVWAPSGSWLVARRSVGIPVGQDVPRARDSRGQRPYGTNGWRVWDHGACGRSVGPESDDEQDADQQCQRLQGACASLRQSSCAGRGVGRDTNRRAGAGKKLADTWPWYLVTPDRRYVHFSHRHATPGEAGTSPVGVSRSCHTTGSRHPPRMAMAAQKTAATWFGGGGVSGFDSPSGRSPFVILRRRSATL